MSKLIGVLALLIGVTECQVARKRPSLSGQAGGVATKGTGQSSEESLGSQLLTAVLADDLEGAGTSARDRC